MTSYVGRHASLYDIFYSSKPYEEEAAFLHDSLTELTDFPVKNILELACGTGTHALILEGYGYKLRALDSSKDMINRAVQKAEEQGSKVKFSCNDMRNISELDEEFDAIICLFDSIGYVRDNASILKVLKGVESKLRPGGLFLYEFWHAPAMVKNFDPVRVKEFNFDDAKIIRISETTLDYEKQLAQVSYTIHNHSNDGQYTTFKETQVNRFFQVQEMKLFLQQSNLYPERFCAGYTKDENITEDTWHIVAIARKPA